MARARSIGAKHTGNAAEQLRTTVSPEMAKVLKHLHAKYGRYSVSLEQLRRDLDEEMGSKSLTEELFLMREGR